MVLGAEQDDAYGGAEGQECLPGRAAVQHDAARDRARYGQEEPQGRPIRIGHGYKCTPLVDGLIAEA